jgi:hypothetical protein
MTEDLKLKAGQPVAVRQFNISNKYIRNYD